MATKGDVDFILHAFNYATEIMDKTHLETDV